MAAYVRTGRHRNSGEVARHVRIKDPDPHFYCPAITVTGAVLAITGP